MTVFVYFVELYEKSLECVIVEIVVRNEHAVRFYASSIYDLLYNC